MAKSIYTPQYDVFKNTLRAIRLESGLSQVILAERLGVPQSRISKAESGQRRLDYVELRAWLLELGSDPVQFSRRVEAQLSAQSSRGNTRMRRVAPRMTRR